MDIPSKAIVDVLSYLLPGFITAAIVYNLTPSPRPVPFERVVQALIFTIVVQVVVLALRAALLAAGSRWGTIGIWSSDTQLIWSVAVATVLGLAVARAVSTDQLHALLRRLGITQQTSFPSEWFGAFSQNRGYIVLHLSGKRRLYGWAEEWPSTPGSGHFVLSRAQWLTDTGAIDLVNVERIVVKAGDVQMVEMMCATTSTAKETPNGRPQSPESAPVAAITVAREDRRGTLDHPGPPAGPASAASASAPTRAIADVQVSPPRNQ